MSGLGLSLWDVLLHVINIVIMFVVLRFLLYKPINKFINKRAEAIKKQMDDAAEKQAEAERVKAEYEEMLKNAQSLAGELIEKSKETADNQAKVIIADAKKEAAEIVSRSEAEIENMKIKAKNDMREEIVKMAVNIAENVLSREVSVEDNMKTIDRFFEERTVK